MRTEKELWEIVLSRPDLFTYGLCSWVEAAAVLSLISKKEYQEIRRILIKRLPHREKVFLYCCPSCNIQPRIEWIEKRIETI